jgi:hypothetical protein
MRGTAVNVINTGRTNAVGALGLRQSGTRFSLVCGFSRYARKNRTQRTEKHHAAAGKTRRCDAE